MKTFKKSAVANENPDYLIRNPFMLLQKDAKFYFKGSEKSLYPITERRKPFVTIRKDLHLGNSRDFPFKKYIENPLTPELWLKGFHDSRNYTSNAHLSLKNIQREAGNNDSIFLKKLSKDAINCNPGRYFYKFINSCKDFESTEAFIKRKQKMIETNSKLSIVKQGTLKELQFIFQIN